MSDFSARILDDILNGKKVVMSSKMSLVSDEVEDEEILDDLDDVENEEVSDELDDVEDKEISDELDDVEDKEISDELDDVEISEDEEVLDELDSVDEVPTSASPSEELKAFSQLEETVDNFIINSDIDFSAHPRLKEFAQKYTEELETTIDELRQEKNDSLFEGVVSNKVIKASNVNKKSAVESAAYQGEYEVAVTIFDAKGNLKKVRKKFKTEDARAKWIDKQEESGNLYEVDGYLDPEN
ncbi:MAG: hypothetical protein PHQ64_04755 [Bacilli bacterium]|nr:hypothetical protein [Bacilli bacterium]